MCSFKTLGVSWPPRGWKQLETIENSTGQAIIKDPRFARVAGLSYSIEALPLYQKNGTRKFIYAVEIDGWEYTIHNKSQEFPILSYMLRDRPDISVPKHLCLSNLKTHSCPVRITERSAHRAIMATLFLVKQINSGLVPDAERILRLYKLHPTQRSLYEIESAYYDSISCGLPERLPENARDDSDLESL